jgi:amino acid adenylation domain-containing protein
MSVSEVSAPGLYSLFAQAAAVNPTALAVTKYRGATISYGDLDRRVIDYAQVLGTRGVGAGDTVGVHLANGIEFAAWVLATLRQGAILLPIDSRLPADRISAIISDAEPSVVITDSETDSSDLFATLPSTAEVLATPVAATGSSDADRSADDQPDAAAYLLYTSGSTGTPKGVLVPHRGVVNHVQWMASEMPLGAGSSILLKSAHSFDAWLLEFFWALGNGHRLVMAETGRIADPAYLLDLIATESVNGIVAVPTLLHRLVSLPKYSELDSLTYIIAAGETLHAALADQVFANPATTLYNLYGPTEASIDATFYRVERGQVSDPIPIGATIPGTVVHVVDDDLRSVAAGVAGEIVIGGSGVGLGYLGRETETAERFLLDVPSLGPGRFFRTGDLGKFEANGQLLYLGRRDRQLKINGVRVEPAEAERVLKLHDTILDCAVDMRTIGDNQKALVAFVVTTDKGIPPSHYIEYTRRQIPPQFAPSAYVYVDEIPTLPNGKRDYAALPTPRALPRQLPEAFEKPRSDTEHQLALLWSEGLGLEPVGVHDDFYTLGGDSLKTIDVLLKISEGIYPGVFDLAITQMPTIAELAAIIDARPREAEPVST